MTDELVPKLTGIMLVPDPSRVVLELKSTSTMDMTAEAAAAMRDTAEAQYAVPEREETKREYARSGIEILRLLLVAGVIAGGLFAPGLPDAGRVGILVAAVGALGAPAIIDKLKKPKPPPAS